MAPPPLPPRVPTFDEEYGKRHKEKVQMSLEKTRSEETPFPLVLFVAPIYGWFLLIIEGVEWLSKRFDNKPNGD